MEVEVSYMIRPLVRSLKRAITDPGAYIDVTGPVVALLTTYSVDKSPLLSGTVDDKFARVFVTVDGLVYEAVVSGDGSWSIAAGVVTNLPIGYSNVNVSAVDLAGNRTENNVLFYLFDPSLLFANGETGWWYDANDLTEEKINWRRNLFTYSEDFAWNWIATGTTVAYSDIQSPSGDSFATKIVEAAVSSVHQIYKSATFEFNQNYVFSVYAKAGERKNIRMHWNATSVELAADVDLLTGNVIRGTNVTVTNVGGGWYRISKVMQRSSANALCIAVMNDAWLSTYTGDGVSGLYIWGAQFEKGDVATPYQKITDFDSDFIRAFPDHTLFQDSAGSIPVHGFDQSVGLHLDKSRGLALGAELASNGDFSSGLTGWSESTAGYWQVIGGRAYHAPTDQYRDLRRSFALTGWAELRCTLEVLSGQAIAGFNYSGSSFFRFYGVGVHNIVLRSPITPATVLFFSRSVGVTEFYVDNVSVRELPGNHRFQSNAAARPILRRSPILGEEIATPSKWGNGNVGIVKDTQAGTVTFTGSQVAYALMPFDTNYIPAVGDVFEVSFTVSGSTQGRVQVRLGGVKSYVNGNGSFRILQTATDNGYPIVQEDGGVGSRFIGTLSNISIKKVNGYYSDRHFLEADGVDDGFETLPVNFNNSKQISLMSGMRKMSDLTTGIFVEMSSSYGNTAGSFGLFAPSSSNTPRIGFYSRGVSATIASALDTNIPAPVSVVVTGTSDLLTNNTKLRINGVQKATSSQDQGGGSFTNNSAYFFKRAGGSIPFRGNEYSSIMVNRLLTELELICAEILLSKLISQ